jgi:dTMP kinase
MNMDNPAMPRCVRGPLVSIEGISGAGKTTLTKLAIAQLAAAGHQVTGINDFSARNATEGGDLGREFLHALIGAANGDRFLRGGHLYAETLLLLAIKTYDYEANARAASAGQIIIDGRSLDTTAVYQSVLMHPGDDEAALEEARRILRLAGQWRPLPDLTILICSDPELALDRASRRDQRSFTFEERLIELRADHLFRQLAAQDPARIHVLNPDGLVPEAAATVMADLIASIFLDLDCQPHLGTFCGQACRFMSASIRQQPPVRI